MRLVSFIRVFALSSLLAAAMGAAGAQGYRIGSVAYEIEGRTLEWALSDLLEIDTRHIFPDRTALDEYVREKTQLLRNQRLLEESSIEVDEPKLSPAEGGESIVGLLVRTKDAGSVIVLPKPGYDSNSGLLFSLGWQDNNFLGAMQPIKFDLKYTSDKSGQRIWGERFCFVWPFRLGGNSFSWNLDQSIGYYSEDKVLSFRSQSGVDMILPLWDGKLRFGPSQGYYLNPYDEVEKLYRGWYLASSARAEYEYDLPFELGSLGPLTMTLGEGVTHYWNTDGFGDEERRDAEVKLGPTINSTQALSLSSVDWIGNFRRGIAAEASAAEDYDLGARAWVDKLTTSVSAYETVGSRIGISGRIMAERLANDSDRLAGEPLRGILDTRVDTDAAIYANMDLSFFLIRFAPRDEAGNLKWRLISFEQQWSPFLDAALTRDSVTGRLFDIRDAWYSGGLEVITYPLAYKSFYIRVSLGWDLRALLDNAKESSFSLHTLFADSPRDGEKGYELFIGLGSHY